METPLTLYTASPISLLSIVSPSKYPSLLHRVFPSPFFPFSSLPFFPRICLPNDLYRHSTRISHIRNSSPPPLHPDVSHPEFCPVNVLLYPDVSHPKFFSAATPPGCLTPGILPRQHSTFHPDISHSEFYPANVPPSPDISHPESCPSTFNLPRISRFRNSVQPTSHLFLHP